MSLAEREGQRQREKKEINKNEEKIERQRISEARTFGSICRRLRISEPTAAACTAAACAASACEGPQRGSRCLTRGGLVQAEEVHRALERLARRRRLGLQPPCEAKPELPWRLPWRLA